MLVVYPLGLLGTSVAWDICSLVTKHERWAVISFWTIVAGLIGGVVAAVPGLVDWLGIPPRTRARKIGLYHMIFNVVVLALFAISLAVRARGPGGYGLAGMNSMVWGWIGVAVAGVSGWLGGELIETLGISVAEGAHPNAESSLAPKSEAKSAREQRNADV
jgi:uncharacterized membrane protein